MGKAEKPLSGIRVVELANYVAAPIVGRMLADLGADVIKIEGRGGDAWRAASCDQTHTPEDENPMFDLFNVGKKSLSLNLKNEKGKEVFFRLLENADILITNTRQQSLVKLGVDYASIKDRFPRLIYATLTGYGYEGPDCNAPGFDNIAFWARPGFSVDMSIDTEGSYPVNSRFAMGDTMSGSVLFGGVMTALYQRERTGKGDFVTMSLYNAGIWLMSGSVLMSQKPYCHPLPEKRNFGNPFNLSYKCADGEWVRCTIFEYDRYCDKFYTALGVEKEIGAMGVKSMEDLVANADKAVPLFELAFLKKTHCQWLAVFRDLDIVCGKLNHFRDVLEDEQAWANEYIQKFRCVNGEERVMTTCPVRLGSQGALPVGKAISYAEHNEEVLASLGYKKEEIENMKNNGALS